MRIVFLYRLKKYGTWHEGQMNVDANATDLQRLVEQHLKECYPTATRIEIQSIRKK